MSNKAKDLYCSSNLQKQTMDLLKAKFIYTYIKEKEKKKEHDLQEKYHNQYLEGVFAFIKEQPIIGSEYIATKEEQELYIIIFKKKKKNYT